ncbi:hypothetical protein OGV36_07630 [Citrobacter sp. Cb008]|uniref:hypothetical protein n=1 Tax=Citrobacter TaxID=544 RepID=UPI0003301E2B|nr:MULTISPECIES: hypothetical protein [Citrobacter]EOQ31595.1 hypothetical protein WEU_01549 [Citrobacter sp. KTE32]MDM3366539.1 hypothetical protein [Citrobacter sp. Cb005]MDM3370232.1 hypothetical protein [Citrobacter sp. Cb008]
MKPDVNKIIADIKATKGNRKFCNGLAGTLQDDNYASSICKYVKTVTPERIDLLIEYAEKLEAEVTDKAVQLANAESKCRELAAENAGLKSTCDDRRTFIMNGVQLGYIKVPTVDTDPALETIRIAVSPQEPTPITDAFLTEVRAQGVEMYADNLDSGAEDAERDGFDDAVKFLRSEASGVRLFAAQLRKGDKS